MKITRLDILRRLGKAGRLTPKCGFTFGRPAVSVTAGFRHLLVALAVASLMVACGGMSRQEKKMIGKYYIPDLSDTRPLIELNDHNQSVFRAVRPGELSFYVTGIWHVHSDSLIIENDISSITIEEGDASLVGHIAPRVAYPIVEWNETTMRIMRQGIYYDYQRRKE